MSRRQHPTHPQIIAAFHDPHDDPAHHSLEDLIQEPHRTYFTYRWECVCGRVGTRNFYRSRAAARLEYGLHVHGPDLSNHLSTQQRQHALDLRIVEGPAYLWSCSCGESAGSPFGTQQERRALAAHASHATAAQDAAVSLYLDVAESILTPDQRRHREHLRQERVTTRDAERRAALAAKDAQRRALQELI